MDRLRFQARRLGVELSSAPSVTHAVLTHFEEDPSELVVSSDLPRERQLPAAAALLKTIDLGWPGREHRFNYVMTGDGWETSTRLANVRRMFREPYRLGLRDLMPDRWMARIAREGIEPREAAEEASVTVADFVFRWGDFTAERARRVKAEKKLDVGGWMKALKIVRGSEIPPPKKRRMGRPDPAAEYWIHALPDLEPKPPKPAPQHQAQAPIILPTAPKLPPPEPPSADDVEFMRIDPATGMRRYPLAAHVDLPLPKPPAQFRTTHGWLMKVYRDNQDARPAPPDDSYGSAIPL